VAIAYRGARYEIGQGPGWYGIWPVAAPQPVQWWPQTPGGWAAAWSRFTQIESASAITAAEIAVPADPPGSRGRADLAAALIVVGVLCGIAGLFPGYFGAASLARHPDELVPHAIYLVTWAASAVLILRGGARLRAGALLGLGAGIVTFGLFLADLGTALAGSASAVGTGLVLSLMGWVICTAGAGVAWGIRSAGGPRRPQRCDTPTVAVLTVAAVGAAITFAPSWDRYTLQTAAGTVQTLTAGNAFANPALVIAGNMAVMVAIVAVVAMAALCRPARLGAALLAGATVPLVGQLISALAEVHAGTSAAQFGITPGAAARARLTITTGVTAAFWLYCLFVLVLVVSCGWLLLSRYPVIPDPPGPARPSAPPSSAPPPVASGLPAAKPGTPQEQAPRWLARD